MPLKMWAKYKMRNDKQYKQFEEYTKDPKIVLKQLKEVVDVFKKPNDRTFSNSYYSILGDVSSVLLRDYDDKLSEDELSYCKNIVLGQAMQPLVKDYIYQIGDGIESVISVLPILLKKFPEEKVPIKFILLLTLFNFEVCNHSIKSILYSLWDISFDDAQSLLFGYLSLKPKYEELRVQLREEYYKKGISTIPEVEVIKRFGNEHEDDIKNVIDNKITINDLKIENLDLNILKTAFEIIPLKTDNIEHKELVKTIISTFAKNLLSNKRGDGTDYRVRQIFLEKLAYFVLSSSEQDIYDYLKPFIDNFNNSEAMADLFEEFVHAEDRLNCYNNFWKIWNLFYEKIVEICKDGDNYYTNEVIKSYLFAQSPWKQEATGWHTFKETDKRFFKKITENMGSCPSVLFSISKLLNGIGSIYLNDGVLWISKMLKVNKSLWESELEDYTISYLEKIVRKYSYLNREELRKIPQLKHDFLVILDFLIEKGSVVGYTLREDIL